MVTTTMEIVDLFTMRSSKYIFIYICATSLISQSIMWLQIWHPNVILWYYYYYYYQPSYSSFSSR